MSKVFISPGHGGDDWGATGYLVEKDANLKMAKACAAYLLDRGVDVLLSRAVDGNESLAGKIKACNDFNPDVAVECHNNAGGGDGFEIYHSIVGGVGKELAKNIETEIIKIGQNSRGLKTRVGSSGADYFAFIRQTNCPAVICEGAFVDNKADAEQIDTDAECKNFGEAYARGVLKTLNSTDIVEKSPVDDTQEKGYRVKVTTVALNVRSGPGTNYKISQVILDEGVYTIVEERTVNGIRWGRLKSGAGWIGLSFTERI